MRGRKRMKILKQILLYVTTLLMAVIALLPFYVLIFISVSSPSMRISRGIFVMPDFHLENYIDAWQTSTLGISIVNSIIISGGALAVLILVSASAGYAIARFENRWHNIVFKAFLFSMMVPAIINTVPLYTLMKSIGGINTHWAMILLLATNGIPFSVFLYTGFIKSISKEVEESAIIDGCTWFSAFWRIIFHFLKPVTAAVVIIQGMAMWNNYAQAVFFLQRRSMHTIPLSISSFFHKYGADWNLMAAAAVIGMAPAVIAFLIFQKYFIKGIASGAVKG